MITTLPVVGSAVSGASRRRLYRRSKRLLSRMLTRRWSGPRWTLEPAVRRFLRARSRSFLARLLGDRGFALAAVGSLAATPTAGALPLIELSDVAAGTGGFVMNGIDIFDFSGDSVSGAGDVNGDGLADLIVGASSADPGGGRGARGSGPPPPGDAGESYVIFSPVVPCPEDVNGDGTVNVLDLIDLLLCFGQPAVPSCEAEDINEDGTVNVLDLIDLLLEFGQACP